MAIDSHHHVWRIGKNDCVWPTPALAAIYRDYAVADLTPLANACGVDGTVLVQSQASDLDTDFLCDLAATADLVKAVVGWADLKAPSAPPRIETLSRRSKVRGLRPLLQDLPAEWIEDPALDAAIQTMERLSLTFDALVYPAHLASLLKFAKRHPALTIVIDHAAKPRIRDRQFEPWATGMTALAALPNVSCKLSGLLTEAGPYRADADLAPYISHILHAFGASRLIWGSDWPVLNLAASYSDWMAQTRRLLAQCSAEEQDWIFSANATRVYRLAP